MGNVVMESDANANIKPNKKKSANKIDPAVSALMAFGTFQSEHEDFAFDMSHQHKERLEIYWHLVMRCSERCRYETVD